MQSNQQRVLAKVKEIIAIAQEKFDVDLSNLEVKFNITSDRTLGQAQRRGGRYIMRFHPKAMEFDIDEYVNSVVPHELAHIVCFMKPSLGRNHDSGFKRVATMLGDIRKGAVTTNAFQGMETKAKERHVYRHAGRDIIVGPGQHQKVQVGHQYRVKGGGILLKSEYVGVALFKDGEMIGKPAEYKPTEAPKTPATPRKPAKAPAGVQGMSTAAQVRRYLSTAFASRAEAEANIPSIVEVAMSFGIRTKGAARQCVTANIPKVFA